MRLYLVQHGEAHPSEVDPERRLTEAGRREVEKVARFIAPLRLEVEQVWHSNRARAQATAEILAGAMSVRGGSGPRDELGPNDPVHPMHRAVEHARGDLMIVGHLPFLAKLAGALVAKHEANFVVAFQYGAVACLERGREGEWRVAWAVRPELLP